MWQVNLGQPGIIGSDACFAAAVWDGSRLILSGAGSSLVNGTVYDGSVRAVDPPTGAVLWQTGIPAQVLGTPAEDGAGLVAVPGYKSSNGTYGVFLVRATDGTVLGWLPSQGIDFAQPAFAGSDLLVAGGPSVGLTAYDATIRGAPLTGVSPTFVRAGQTKTVAITGTGFTGVPTVFVSGFGVATTSVQVVSSTKVSVTLTVSPGVGPCPRGLTVVGAGATTDSCTGCLFVVPASTTVVTSSLNPSVAGQPVTFTASVTPTDGHGTVSFAAERIDRRRMRRAAADDHRPGGGAGNVHDVHADGEDARDLGGLQRGQRKRRFICRFGRRQVTNAH